MVKKPVFIYSKELEKYAYPPEHPFNTIRAKRVRETVHSMGLLSESDASEVAPRPAERIVLKKLHTPRYLHALQTASRGRWTPEALAMGIGTDDCPIFKGLYEYTLLATGGTLVLRPWGSSTQT